MKLILPPCPLPPCPLPPILQKVVSTGAKKFWSKIQKFKVPNAAELVFRGTEVRQGDDVH